MPVDAGGLGGVLSAGVVAGKLVDVAGPVPPWMVGLGAVAVIVVDLGHFRAIAVAEEARVACAAAEEPTAAMAAEQAAQNIAERDAACDARRGRGGVL